MAGCPRHLAKSQNLDFSTGSHFLVSSLSTLSQQELLTFRRRAEARVNNIHVSVFLDSGNTWHSAISEKFLATLNRTSADLEKIPEVESVATANEKGRLQVLGRLRKPLKLQFVGHETAINFTPVVLRDLAMDINISGPFLKRHGIDQFCFGPVTGQLPNFRPPHFSHGP